MNSYFQFKQFILHQDQCAMKVCTDACLLGAYTAHYIQEKKPDIFSILDIGTGTGLLSLMLAQKTNMVIHAVEKDVMAYKQAAGNFNLSIWKEKLNAVHADIRQFRPGKKYEMIISNPPFFEKDLLSGDERIDMAKHDSGLTLDELMEAAVRLLEDNGSFFVLLPAQREKDFLEKANGNGLNIQHTLWIRQTDKHPFFRFIAILGKNRTAAERKEMVIKPDGENYSKEFIELLGDYYLYL